VESDQEFFIKKAAFDRFIQARPRLSGVRVLIVTARRMLRLAIIFSQEGEFYV